MAPRDQRKPKAYQSLLAGATAGGVESLATYPTEYIKTKQQLASSGGTATSPLRILLSTIRNHGIRPIYTGAGVFCLSNSSKSAVRFVVFDAVRGRLPHDSRFSIMCAGLCTGIAESMTVLTPGENLKTKLIDSRGGAAYTSTRQAVSRILASDGTSGLYRGALPVTLKQSANAVVRFTSYQFMLENVQALFKERNPQLVALSPGIAGGLAGIITVYATMPFDNVKTKMQSMDGARAYTGSFDCLRIILRTEGVRSLWRGTTPRLVRLSVSGAVSFSIYEKVIQLTSRAQLKTREKSRNALAEKSAQL